MVQRSKEKVRLSCSFYPFSFYPSFSLVAKGALGQANGLPLANVLWADPRKQQKLGSYENGLHILFNWRLATPCGSKILVFFLLVFLILHRNRLQTPARGATALGEEQ